METNREADLYTPKEALKPKGDMYAQITQIGDSIQEKLVEFRRDFHKHPETAWLEMRT